MLPVRFKTILVRTLAVTIILLVAASLVGAAVLWHSSALPSIESAPCGGCSSLYSSAKVVDSDVCALSASPESFRDQLVRVHGIFVHDSCYTHMVSDSCRTDFVRVGISRDIAACRGAQKALGICTGLGEWYDSSAVAIVVGRMHEIENQQSCNRGQFGLDILCLESVRPIDGVKPPRLHYAVGKLFDFIAFILGVRRPNQAMQRTASKHTLLTMNVCHTTVSDDSRLSGLAVADLMSR